MTEIKIKMDLALIQACINEGGIIDKDLMFADLSFLGDTQSSRCHPDLGDGRKSWNKQYKCMTRNGVDYVCVGRCQINSLGNPTGGFEQLPKGEFEKWVIAFTADNMYPYEDLPEELE